MEFLHETGWAAMPKTAEAPPIGETSCDVVVVGGGVGGMAAAIRLAETGADVVLLEARTLGWGASSRNAGYVTNSIAADPELLALLLKPERLRELYRFADRAVHFTEDTITRRNIDCHYQKAGIVIAAVSKGQLRRARRYSKIMVESGSSAEFVDGRAAGLPAAFLGGIREGIGGSLNPGEFVQGLRAATFGAGVRVYEHCPATKVDDIGHGVTVDVPTGRVCADRALLTTNAYSGGLGATPRRLASPLWTSLIETEPVAAERLDDIGWTSRAPMVTLHMIMENYRLTSSGTIVFGTRRVQTGRHPLPDRVPDRRVVDDLMRGFRRRFPELSDIEPCRAWGGWIAMTPSWLPVAGQASDNVLYSLACNGHGFAQAQYVGHLLADRIAGAACHDDLRAIWRQRQRFWPGLVSGPTMYAAWLADRASDRLSTAKG